MLAYTIQTPLQRVIRNILRKSHKVILPGVAGASLFEVGKFFVTEIRNVKITERTAAVTYNFLMALPPSFLFLFSLIPYLPLYNVEQTVLNTLRLVTPEGSFYTSVSGVISDFLHTEHRDLLSFGVLLTLLFSSNGMIGLMRGFDNSLVLYKKRTGLQRRWTAIKLTLMLMLVSILALAVLILQNSTINNYVLKVYPSLWLVKVLSYVVLFGLIFLNNCLIYSYGPSLKRKFRFVSAGSVFATFASLLTTSVFYFLVDNFLNYNKIYGSVGTIIAFMVLVWLNTLIILLGFELNVSLLMGKIYHERDQTI